MKDNSFPCTKDRNSALAPVIDISPWNPPPSESKNNKHNETSKTTERTVIADDDVEEGATERQDSLASTNNQDPTEQDGDDADKPPICISWVLPLAGAVTTLVGALAFYVAQAVH